MEFPEQKFLFTVKTKMSGLSFLVPFAICDSALQKPTYMYVQVMPISWKFIDCILYKTQAAAN